MAFDRFLVGPINTGLERDLKPFLIADDAFTLLQNCYVFRGRVENVSVLYGWVKVINY